MAWKPYLAVWMEKNGRSRMDKKKRTYGDPGMIYMINCVLLGAPSVPRMGHQTIHVLQEAHLPMDLRLLVLHGAHFGRVAQQGCL